LLDRYCSTLPRLIGGRRQRKHSNILLGNPFRRNDKRPDQQVSGKQRMRTAAYFFDTMEENHARQTFSDPR
jgi:hypothetical protein